MKKGDFHLAAELFNCLPLKNANARAKIKYTDNQSIIKIISSTIIRIRTPLCEIQKVNLLLTRLRHRKT